MSKPLRKLTRFETETVRDFSNMLGITIENSKLFTELKDTKENLYKAYENLKELHKLKDDFLSVASHELRTPMTIIKSYLWMLKEGKAGNLNIKQQEYITKAADGTKRMIRLINEMLNVSQLEQGGMSFDIRKINVCRIVDEVLSGLELKIEEKGLSADVHKEKEKAYVYADEPKLREVLVNLVSNAIKFTDHGGITLEIAESPSTVRVSITDTGRGITKDDQLRLFHKFGRLDYSYQTVAETSGTGLGLYIVKLYVEGMDGEVGVHSDGLGRGSTFWFTLPKKHLAKTAKETVTRITSN
jgi:signal transduction histidine kinase